MEFVDRKPDVIRSIQHRWLLKYWIGLRGAEALPTWSQVELQEAARVMDQAIVFDVVQNSDGPRFRIRFQGVRITEAYGADCSGKFLDQTQPPSTRETTLAVYRHAVQVARPLYTIAEVCDSTGQSVDHERLLLPFRRGDSPAVSRILTVLQTISVEGRFQQHRLLSSPPGLNYSVFAAIDFAAR